MGKRIKAIINDVNGAPSAMRVAVLGLIFIISLTWAMVSIRNNALQPVDMETVMMVLGALGFKTWQRDIEMDAGTFSSPVESSEVETGKTRGQIQETADQR